MLWTKKSMFKYGSFLPALSRVRDYASFLGYFLSSRRTLKDLFVRFERTYIGVVFNTKITAGNLCAFSGQRLKNTKN